MSIYILPIFICGLIIYAFIKKINVYNSFTLGAQKSFELIKNVLPNLIAVFLIIDLMNYSGLISILSTTCGPFFNAIGIPSEVIPLMFFKPLSGSGSTAYLETILSTYGVDSYIGKCACIICSCSETTFFVTTVYFCSTKTKKLRFTVFISIFSMFFANIIACVLAKYI